MTQAIARCRRYGQKKKVLVYHFAALYTIDVDVLQQRHRRTDALSRHGVLSSPNKKLEVKPERTRMIINSEQVAHLVPQSWLENEEQCQKLGIKKGCDERLTSLIPLAEWFGED
jgi:hypothetical protein